MMKKADSPNTMKWYGNTAAGDNIRSSKFPKFLEGYLPFKLYILFVFLISCSLIFSSSNIIIAFLFYLPFSALIIVSMNYFNVAWVKYSLSSIAFLLHVSSTILSPVNHYGFMVIAYVIPFLYAVLLRDIVSSVVVAVLDILILRNNTGYYNASNIFTILCFSFLLGIIIFLIYRLINELNKYRQMSITDSLTGLSTISFTLEEGQKMLDKNNEVAALLIDMDRFKQINDTYGHLTGNKLLKQVANIIKSVTSEYDCVAGRLGGDEFIIIANNQDYLQTKELKRKLYNGLNNSTFNADPELGPIKLSCTIGEAISSTQSTSKIEDLLNSADMNMYFNKYKTYNIDLDKGSELLSKRCRQLLKSLAEKDVYTYVHSQYVAQYAFEIARKLKMPDEYANDLYIAGWLHDIGKLMIPNDIIRKPVKLSDEEYGIVKEHVTDGLNILSGMELSDTARNAILYHHERWDGRGYPFGVSGTDTPLEGRIMQVSDVFSAITVKRVYRECLSLGDAILEMKRNSGTQFDPEMVNVLVDTIMNKKNKIGPQEINQI